MLVVIVNSIFLYLLILLIVFVTFPHCYQLRSARLKLKLLID